MHIGGLTFHETNERENTFANVLVLVHKSRAQDPSYGYILYNT